MFTILSCLKRRRGSKIFKKTVLSAIRQYTGKGQKNGQHSKPKVLASSANHLPLPTKVRDSDSWSDAQPNNLPESSEAPNQILKHGKGVEKPVIYGPVSKDFALHHAANRIPLPEFQSPLLHSGSTTSGSKETQDPKCGVTILHAITNQDLDWHQQVVNPRLLLRHYMKLSKIRLTGLVVLTTAAGYGMAAPPFDPTIFLYALIGTGLMSSAANTLNQFLEVPYDSQMTRTKNRVLIRGLLTPLHAVSFAICSGTLGLSLLYFGVNGLTAVLGATNLFLYTSVYTPMKRISILNTWVGSIVGAIPPLMGWAACAGTLDAGSLLLGAILFSWQFPHFNALSWNLRPDYSRAGYRMMSVVNPSLCKSTALRHSIAILVFCTLSPLFDLTTWMFAIDSVPLNCYLIYCAWNFYRKGDSQSSRKLFRLSLIHLPALMLLMFVGKKYSEKSTL